VRGLDYAVAARSVGVLVLAEDSRVLDERGVVLPQALLGEAVAVAVAGEGLGAAHGDQVNGHFARVKF
jgi:hypothetical protein